MLDFSDETLDQVPLAVQPCGVITQDFGALMGWNHRLNTTIQQILDEMGRRVAPVSNQSLKFKPIQQVLSAGNVVTLPGGQAETQGVAQSIYRHMDFGGEAASTTSEGLLTVFFSAPAAQGWARMMVLSIRPYSRSGSCAK